MVKLSEFVLFSYIVSGDVQSINVTKTLLLSCLQESFIQLIVGRVWVE